MRVTEATRPLALSARHHFLSATHPALGADAFERVGTLRDLVVLRDLDPVALRRREDLAPRLFFRGDALERRLVEACDRVADVVRIVDRQVLSAFLVDVGEVLTGDVLATRLRELCHRGPPTCSWGPVARGSAPDSAVSRRRARSGLPSPARDNRPTESRS